MKTKTTATNLTEEDLCNLLATALEGSFWAGVDYPEELKKHKHKLKKENDCFEDLLARWLLRDPKNYIIIYDAESSYDQEENSELGEDYWRVTAADIERGWSQAINNAKGKFPCLDDMDLYDADEVLQMAIFGEVVYG